METNVAQDARPMDKLHGPREKLLARSLGPNEVVLARLNGCNKEASLVLGLLLKDPYGFRSVEACSVRWCQGE